METIGPNLSHFSGKMAQIRMFDINRLYHGEHLVCK